MDTLTHTVLGACVGEVLGGRKLGKKAMLWGALANNFPDVDVITSLWMNQPDSLLAHRGFTHSILFAVAITLVAGWLMKKLFRKNQFSAFEWAMLWGVNLFLHLFIDAFTSYGTGWYEPFSHRRISFNVLFVVDPFYTLSLLLITLVLLFLKNNQPKRMRWSLAGLMVSSMYLCYALYNKSEVDRITRGSLKNESQGTIDFITTPTPFNNFLWYILAKNKEGYYIGYYSVFDRSKQIEFHYTTRNDSLLNAIANDDELKKLIRFSQGYYTVERIHDTLVFNDLRFGQIGGWNSGDAPFVFQYKLAKNVNNDVLIQRGRFKASTNEVLKEMIERIKGN